MYVDSVTCNSDVIAPIGANPLVVRHAYSSNNAAFKMSVQGSDVMGACVDPTLVTSRDSCTAETLITVSSSDCSYPNVVIVDQASVFTSPRTIRRSRQLDLQSLVDIDCATTLRNTKVRSQCTCSVNSLLSWHNDIVVITYTYDVATSIQVSTKHYTLALTKRCKLLLS